MFGFSSIASLFMGLSFDRGKRCEEGFWYLQHGNQIIRNMEIVLKTGVGIGPDGFVL